MNKLLNTAENETYVFCFFDSRGNSINFCQVLFVKRCKKCLQTLDCADNEHTAFKEQSD